MSDYDFEDLRGGDSWSGSGVWDCSETVSDGCSAVVCWLVTHQQWWDGCEKFSWSPYVNLIHWGLPSTRSFIKWSGTPAATTEVAAPMRKLCPQYWNDLRCAAERALQTPVTNWLVWVGENCCYVRTDVHLAWWVGTQPKSSEWRQQDSGLFCFSQVHCDTSATLTFLRWINAYSRQGCVWIHAHSHQKPELMWEWWMFLQQTLLSVKTQRRPGT